MKPTQAKLVIQPSGNATLIPGGSGDLTATIMQVVHSRSIVPGEYANFHSSGFGFGQENPHVEFKDDVGGPKMVVTIGGRSVICEKLQPSATFKDKSSYQLAARYIDVDRMSLKCIQGVKDLGKHEYSLKNGVVTFMGESMSLMANILRESAYVMPQPENAPEKVMLFYTATFTNGSKFSLFYDAYGDFMTLTYDKGDENPLLCSQDK